MDEQTEFQLISLASPQDGRAFDGMAFGEFTDMMGRKIKLDPADATDYVNNTRSAIEHTRTESGEVVGLPIDSGNHDKGDAAGWIIGVELVGNIIRFIPKWTRIGLELIGDGVKRLFSPTVNTRDKAILGGSLTNWPATTDAMGRLMLRPIELSSRIHTFEVESMSDTKDEVLEEVAAIPIPEQPEPAAELEAEPVDVIDMAVVRAEMFAELKAKAYADAQADFAADMAREQEERDIADFAARINERGLPVKADELAELLTELSSEQRVTLKAILERIVNVGIVDFGVVGHGAEIVQLQEFDHRFAPALKVWLTGGRTAAEFFTLNGLGDAADFDLSAYVENN